MNMLSSVNARSHCKIKQSSLACYATPAVNLSVPILLYRALQYPHHWSVNDDVCDWCSTNAKWETHSLKTKRFLLLNQQHLLCQRQKTFQQLNQRRFIFKTWYWQNTGSKVRSYCQMQIWSKSCHTTENDDTDDKPNTSWMQSCTCVSISRWQMTTLWYLYVKAPIFTSNEDSFRMIPILHIRRWCFTFWGLRPDRIMAYCKSQIAHVHL